MNIKCKKIVVAMSGGVDSSVSAYLLKKQGFHVVGLFMKNWEEDDNLEYCSSAVDLSDAQSVCDSLNIQLHTVNFSAEYWNDIFQNFINEYKIGKTPNPDIICNKKLKFKTFLEFASKNLSADYIATGHYVRTRKINKQYQLLRGLDNNKDQSYFLHSLNQIQLMKSLFPLGTLQKSTVREIAKNIGLITANKKDSTGICFIGKRKFKKFISQYISNKPGSIISVDGEILGRHLGLMYHTIGQRKGLGIGGIKNKCNQAWYVVDKDIKNNILVVAQGNLHPRLMSNGLIANNVHWINPINNINKNSYTVKTRYRQIEVPCKIISLNKRTIKVIFNKSIAAVTPGQSAVFYQNEVCLGGGIIKKSFI
uniref:tRNA-specific 2-thiouridylase MnmA n=1 Tax=Candidatus Aschnera chinzeii TaxID=1485666 RepID=A0AAT9G4Z8_9ENTR|nr:MAG: tRNA 2-thiouridine(34) synthase MnmA [Candidatus Aschnera chinzeii]